MIAALCLLVLVASALYLAWEYQHAATAPEPEPERSVDEHAADWQPVLADQLRDWPEQRKHEFGSTLITEIEQWLKEGAK